MSSEPPPGPAAWDCYAQVTSCPVEPDRAGPQGSPANLGRRVCEFSGKPPTPHPGPPILPLALAVDQAGESGEIPTHKAVWVWPRGSGAFRVGDAPWSWLWAESQRSAEALCRPYCDGSCSYTSSAHGYSSHLVRIMSYRLAATYSQTGARGIFRSLIGSLTNLRENIWSWRVFTPGAWVRTLKPLVRVLSFPRGSQQRLSHAV